MNSLYFDHNVGSMRAFSYSFLLFIRLIFRPLLIQGFLILFSFIAGSLESAYSLIWGSHKIWGKGGGDTLDLL